MSSGSTKSTYRRSRRRAGVAAAVVYILASGGVSAETLKEAVAAAYKYNPRIDAARATLRATDEEVSRANALYRPVIQGSADVGYQSVETRPAGATNGITNPRGYGVTGSQPLFRGFRSLNQVREAEAGVRAGRETLRATEQAVLLDAVTAYMDVVRDTTIVRIRENNVSVLSQELKATKERFTVGEVTRTDVAQAEARRAAAVSALDLARANLKISRGNFERHIGRPPSNLTEPSGNVKGVPTSLENAIEISTRESPTVVSSLYREQGARHTVDKIWGELLPTVQVDAAYSRRFDPSITTDESETTTVTGRVTVPIYTNGDVQARVRQAKQTHLARIQEIEQNRADVQSSVVQSWSQLSASRAQLASDKASVESFRVALTGVREEERVGQRTLLDVLNAEQDLLNAEVQLVSTKRNIVVNSYTVLAAVGRLNIQELDAVGTVYDPEAHYHEVRRQWFGVSITRASGKREWYDFWSSHGDQSPPPPSKVGAGGAAASGTDWATSSAPAAPETVVRRAKSAPGKS